MVSAVLQAPGGSDSDSGMGSPAEEMLTLTSSKGELRPGKPQLCDVEGLDKPQEEKLLSLFRLLLMFHIDLISLLLLFPCKAPWCTFI